MMLSFYFLFEYGVTNFLWVELCRNVPLSPCPHQQFAQAEHPMVIVGSGVLQRPDADAIHAAACGIANNVARPQEQGWRTLNILHRVNGGWGGGEGGMA